MKSFLSGLLLAALFAGTLEATPITVVFRFNVYAKYLYTSGEYDSSFVPENITITATFDDTPSSRPVYPNNMETVFGVPVVSSPLTATLPYGPGTTTIAPAAVNSDTLMTDFNFGNGVGDMGSYFQIQENQDNAYGPSLMQSWTYNLEIKMPADNAPPLSNPSTFSGADLVAWLSGLQTSQTPLLYSEYSENFDRTTGHNLGGIGYTGQGVVVGVLLSNPFGSLDIPTNGQTGLVGDVQVGGWALSSTPSVSVQIWRAPVPGENPAAVAANGLVFVEDTIFIAGTRPDVAALYPGYPNSNAAGWGAQLLTNELPNSSGSGPLGNGTYTLHALATDTNGVTTDLGAHMVTVDNAASVLPFGTIDTPAPGATISGTAYVNFGWTLTPQPNDIPTNGLTIWVFIDNQPVGHPVYNNPRSDIQSLFSGYSNTNGAVGYFYINTTTLANGLHQIAWSVTDSAGHTTGIGSRYFTVQN
jgi:hypothetical protein